MTHDQLMVMLQTQRAWPELEANDWRVLAFIAEGLGQGVSSVQLQRAPEFLGTTAKLRPALRRLEAAGLVKRIGGGQGIPSIWVRTPTPLVRVSGSRVL